VHTIATQEDTLERLREKAIERASQFTWARAARQALSSLEGARGS